MTNKSLSIFNQLRPVTVGFDNMFDHFERMFDDDSFFRTPSMTNFPPYNIVKTGKNTYDVELALAGFSKDDIEVHYENNMLTVKSKQKDETEDIELIAETKAIEKIADCCFSADIGARGIKNHFDKILRKTVYDINQLKKQGIISVTITKDAVDKGTDPIYNFSK